MHELSIDLTHDILAAHRKEAEHNLERLKAAGIRAFDLVGSIGSGKTRLIERAVPLLRDQGLRVGAIAGDVAGDDDYRRMKALGMPVVNVNTGKECHLDAHLIQHALDELPLDEIDVLFIENVGNMVCPTDFPLGAEKRVVVVSVTEGDDVVRKHPMMFRESQVCVINKVDLAGAVEADVELMEADAKRIAPSIPVLRTDLKRGLGVEEFLDHLLR